MEYRTGMTGIRTTSRWKERTNVRSTVLTILALGLGASTLSAQAGNPLIAEAKQAYTSIKNNLTAMAAKMPPENYDFKATPDIRTFGQLVAHVADMQMRTCATVKGEQKTADAASKTSKDDLVTALKASFDECDAAFDSLTEANAFEVVGGGRMQRSRLGSLISGVIVHSNEEYGYMSVYLRLKGVVPPSTENMGRGRGRGAQMPSPGR
jgi:uncharacterized damage-inducible protein DinB